MIHPVNWSLTLSSQLCGVPYPSAMKASFFCSVTYPPFSSQRCFPLTAYSGFSINDRHRIQSYNR